MVSKTKVCGKLAPSKQETTWLLEGKLIGDRIHLATYKYRWDDQGEEHIWTVSLGYATKQEAISMQYWLFKNQKAAHSVCRARHRTGTQNKWELKVWGLDNDVLDTLITKANIIQIIKPNGAYRFYQGSRILISVYSQKELEAEAERFIKQGYRIEFEHPQTKLVSLLKLVNGRIEYHPVRKAS
jgi:hypothetical protein